MNTERILLDNEQSIESLNALYKWIEPILNRGEYSSRGGAMFLVISNKDNYNPTPILFEAKLRQAAYLFCKLDTNIAHLKKRYPEYLQDYEIELPSWYLFIDRYTSIKEDDYIFRITKPQLQAIVDSLKSMEDHINYIKKLIQAELDLNSSYTAGLVTIDIFFSSRIKEVLTQYIRAAENSIDICVAWISDNDLIQEVVAAIDRNITVRIICNNDERNHQIATTINQLNGKSITPAKIYQWESTETNTMHNKFALFDQKHIITGSYNWTNGAFHNQENVVLFKDNKIICAQYQTQFDFIVKQITHEDN